MTPALPVLGIMLADRTPDVARPLLAALTRYCRPVLLPVPMPVAAVLLLDPRPVPPPHLPLALLATRVEDLDTPSGRRATVVLTTDPAVLEAAGPRGRALTDGRLPAGSRPVLPYVRGRLRVARGLADGPTDQAVVRADRNGWRWPGVVGPLPAQVEDTAAALASVVVARTPEALLRALAWGAPTVTEPSAAAALGVVDGQHALVGEPAVAAGLTARLLDDPALAARLGLAGRLLVERRHDVDRVALEVTDRLGLRGYVPGAAVWRALDELGTGERSRVRGRVAELVGGVLP